MLVWFRAAPTDCGVSRELFEIMWSDDKEKAKDYIKSLLSDAAKAAAKARTANSNAAFDKAFAAAKILGKTSPNGQLHAGDKAKDNPKDMISWLAASRLWLLLQGVPLQQLFAIAVFCCLSADARAMVFPQLKDFSEPEQLMNGSYTWEDFSSGVLGSALAGRQDTDLQLFYECLSVHSDVQKPDTMGTVAKLEAIWARMQQPVSDFLKICLVHRAVHAKLKDLIAYTADMKPWLLYADFRANVVNHAVPFDQQTARAAARQSSNGGGGNGVNSRDRRSQQRGFPPRQPFKPAGGVQKPQHGKGKFQPKPKFTGKREPVTCYGCGEQGHIRRNCPKEAQQK
ncbi:hypothetical protein OEZ85_010044 [Tetradesmus obliquus]|uniref:CCHC-type domain-containing protein n=1 Tax=Tetradesmus obliquus TaxID=3088 RepID=A0ABY8UBY1_TETOB|nr:hypothetical protein OEZ85_010044 [Tetradesmus obliquus]